MNRVNLEHTVNQVHEFRREGLLITMLGKHCLPENIRSVFEIAFIEGIGFLGA